MIEHKGIRWNFYNKILMPQVPPHVDVEVTKADVDYLFARSKAWMIRWNSDFDCQTPTQWWYVIKDGKIGLEELSRNSRHDVRRGLERCSVARLDANFIANNAYPVYRSVFSRYNTKKKPVSEIQFSAGILQSLTKYPREYWGVFDRSSQKLIGYCANRFQYNCCEYLAGQFAPEYLRSYSSVVLIYEMTRYYLNDLKALYVSDGQRTISHDTLIQEFLIHKLNFRKAYCRLNIVYSPLMRMIVKMLFPFRSFVSPLNENLSTILKQEEIQRSF